MLFSLRGKLPWYRKADIFVYSKTTVRPHTPNILVFNVDTNKNCIDEVFLFSLIPSFCGCTFQSNNELLLNLTNTHLVWGKFPCYLLVWSSPIIAGIGYFPNSNF